MAQLGDAHLLQQLDVSEPAVRRRDDGDLGTGEADDGLELRPAQARGDGHEPQPGLLAGQPRQKELGGVGHLNEHAGVALQPQIQQPQRQGIGKLPHLPPGEAPPGVHQRFLPGDAACVVIAEVRRRLERHVTRDRIP